MIIAIFLVTLFCLVSLYLLVKRFDKEQDPDFLESSRNRSREEGNVIMKGEIIPEVLPLKTPKKKYYRKKDEKKSSEEPKKEETKKEEFKEVKNKPKKTQKKYKKSKKDKGGDGGYDLLLS
jgi:hypothetical protein